MEFRASTFYFNTGNVGIGTASPAAPLDIQADPANPGIVTIRDSNHNLASEIFLENGVAGFDLIGNQTQVVRMGGTSANWIMNNNIGIGTADPEYELDVEGEVAAISYVTTSDRRLKWDIEPLENASEGLQCLQSVTYRWIDRNDGPPQLSQDRQIGLIAQDVEDCFPEVVFTDSKGFESVAYDRLVVPLIENVKEQQARYTALQAVNAAQQAAYAAQQQEMKELKARLARLENLLSNR